MQGEGVYERYVPEGYDATLVEPTVCSSVVQKSASGKSLGRIVASLDRKRRGQATSGRKVMSPEAFSIRRLGGSRWRLRRTRGAMGFEWQSETGVRYERAAENGESAGVVVVAAGSERVGRRQRRRSGYGEDTKA